MVFLHVGLLVLLCVAGAISRSHRTKDGCQDDMLHIADGKYSCNLLVDRSDPYQRILGAYNLRTNLCSKHGHSGCCRTCRDLGLAVQDKRRNHKKSKFSHRIPIKSLDDDRKANINSAPVCEDRMLHVAGGLYDCSMLIDPHHGNQKMVGAFYRRRVLCSKPGHSGCCKTCRELLAGMDTRLRIRSSFNLTSKDHFFPKCKDSGLTLEEGTFSCAMLVTEIALNQTSKGAVANRDRLCNLPGQSGCCLTCTLNGFYKEEQNEEYSGYLNFQRQIRHPRFCRDSNLWLGDGSYDCSLLVDKHHKKQAWTGVYAQRKRLCSKAGFSGCCRTCLKHVIKRNTHRCKDEYVFVNRNKKTYACRELLHHKSDIYTDRFDLCKDKVNTRCCKTCAKVAKTKHHSGSNRYMNMIDKPQTVEIVGLDDSNLRPATRETVEGVHRAYRFMKAILHRLSRFVQIPNNNSL